MCTRYLCIFFLAAAPLAAHAYYRCDRPDATHYFSDAHCAAGDVETEQHARGGEPPRRTAAAEPTIGMRPDQVQALPWPWGKPRDVKRDVTGGHTFEQWTYPTAFVYFKDGAVYLISDR